MKETPRLAAIDGLRAMAMLMVFTFHTWEFANSPHFSVRLGGRTINLWHIPSQGWQGVGIFMVLSGFCLFFPLCFGEERLRNFEWRSYAIRRVRRIVPPYYAAIIYAVAVTLLVAIARYFMGRSNAFDALPTPLDLITHVTFTHSLFPSTFFTIVGAFWSLGLEAQFYLLFPLVVWAFARFRWWAIAGIVLLSLSYHAGLKISGVEAMLSERQLMVAHSFFLPRWMEFAVGMSTALLVARALERKLVTPTWIGLLFVAGGLSLFKIPALDFGPLLSRTALFNLQRAVGTGALLYAICTSTSVVAFPWSNRVSSWLGFVSYSFFLIHHLTIHHISEMIITFGPKMSDMALFGVLMTFGFAICLAVSYGFFLVFEKPFLKNWPLLWPIKRTEN